MRDVLADLQTWFTAGTPFALATVVGVRGSAPREPGAALAVAADGNVIGALSGGCVDGDVYELAREVLETGRPARRTYGVSDDEITVGLTCGGTIDVLIRRVVPAYDEPFGRFLDALATRRAVAWASVSSGPAVGSCLYVYDDHVDGTIGSPYDDAHIADDARRLLARGVHEELACDRHTTVVVRSFPRPARLLLIGATAFAAPLAQMAGLLGYHVTVCDARPTFATAARFPHADEVVREWPHRFLTRAGIDDRTAVCVLTHDPRFDVPALQVALRSPAGYVGAMGSRRTHEARLRRLREAGIEDWELARLCSPIGLDIGPRSAEETALSILAEIVQRRGGATGAPLGTLTGPIHREGVPA